MWKTRSKEPEIIDLDSSNYTQEEYFDCLEKLDRVGRILGGDRATFSSIDKMKPLPGTVLDVGCGGGFFAAKLAKKYPQATVLGIDLHQDAIKFAKTKELQNLSFETRNEKELNEPPKSYDVVLATLVCHHMSDDDLVEFIKRACRVAKRKVIINDLHRHPLAYYSFKFISPIVFSNRLVNHDGPLSVLKAFTRSDWHSLMKKAGIHPSKYTVKWKWAFRWIIEINCERIKND